MVAMLLSRHRAIQTQNKPTQTIHASRSIEPTTPMLEREQTFRESDRDPTVIGDVNSHSASVTFMANSVHQLFPEYVSQTSSALWQASLAFDHVTRDTFHYTYRSLNQF
jgi:hypothetical protein